jgi:magnesium transporter
VLAEAVRDLDSDDVVDLVEDLEDDRQQQAILDALEDPATGSRSQQLADLPGIFRRPPDAARGGGHGPEHWTVGEAIDFLRDQDDLPEQFYHVILVDPRMRPVANVTLGKLMGSRREVLLKSSPRDLSHHSGHTGRGRRGLCLQPVSPDLRPGGGRRRAALWA